jgi:hypothetical protein
LIDVFIDDFLKSCIVSGKISQERIVLEKPTVHDQLELS